MSLPTCPLALTESERALPGIVQELEGEVARLGLEHEVFAVRMTGCTNGCSRPYNCDIGIVGRAAGRYAIYLGGRRIGDRLSFLYRDGVPLEQLVATLVPRAGLLQAASPGRRNARRFLPSPGLRRAHGGIAGVKGSEQ